MGSGQRVVFEQGPRNLRPSVPNGVLTLDLVSEFFSFFLEGFGLEGGGGAKV